MKNHIITYKQLIAAHIAGLLLLCITGCKNAIDVGPPINKLSSVTVFTSNGTAEAAVSGIFGTMASSSGKMYNGSASMSLLQGQAADELVSYATTSVFYPNSLTSQSPYYWPEIYQEMFDINSAIAALNNNGSTLTPAIRNQLLGEVKFARAFIYFYAVNLYGDVPMPLTSDYLANNTISRTPQQVVYAQVVQDLKDAQLLLPDNTYLSGTGTTSVDRVQPNKQAAMALLARVYLYQKDWANAQAMATSVINSSSYLLEPVLNNVFLKGSREAIWQLFPVTAGLNNADAQSLVITGRPTTTSTQVSLNTNLLNAFEPGDGRMANWVGSYVAPAAGALPATTYQFAYKYKVNVVNSANPVTEYPVMLRLAEQYLIRAEAYIQTNQIPLGIADLNTIRARARMAATIAVPNPLPALSTSLSLPDAIDAVAHERQVELFTEMGHRWFDLRRTGKIDAVMNVVTPQKGGAWASYKQLVPVPAAEIVLNSNLTQNPGYN